MSRALRVATRCPTGTLDTAPSRGSRVMAEVTSPAGTLLSRTQEGPCQRRGDRTMPERIMRRPASVARIFRPPSSHRIRNFRWRVIKDSYSPRSEPATGSSIRAEQYGADESTIARRTRSERSDNARGVRDVMRPRNRSERATEGPSAPVPHRAQRRRPQSRSPRPRCGGRTAEPSIAERGPGPTVEAL